MEFKTSDLLKNASYSAKHYKSFTHYITLLNLCKGVVPTTVDVESINQLEKLNFNIDPLTDYITNIFDYNMYIKDGTPDVIYVVKVADKQCTGTLKVDMVGENLRFIAHPTMLPAVSEEIRIVVE